MGITPQTRSYTATPTLHIPPRHPASDHSCLYFPPGAFLWILPTVPCMSFKTSVLPSLSSLDVTALHLNSSLPHAWNSLPTLVLCHAGLEKHWTWAPWPYRWMTFQVLPHWALQPFLHPQQAFCSLQQYFKIWMWELDYKESWAPKNWCFWTVVLQKTLESPLDCKEIQPVHPKADQSWVFIGGTDVEAETPILWPPHAKSWLIWKDPDAGKDWGQEEKGTTEDEMVGWHHRLNGQAFGWTLGVGDGQGGLVCCGSWGHKDSDMTEWVSWIHFIEIFLIWRVEGGVKEWRESVEMRGEWENGEGEDSLEMWKRGGR